MSLPLSTISALPTAPSRSDPSNFNSKAEAFVAALATLRSEINTVVGEINGGLSNATILGTVSQSGGSPTGSIIERGSNANGEYVRFADGTQICYSAFVHDATLNAGVTATGTWTFPAEFASGPRRTLCDISQQNTEAGSGVAAERLAAAALSNTPTTAVWALRNHSAINTSSARLALVAIGRWF